MSISSFNDFQLDEPVQDFLSPEGFARITRDGKSDIYVVQNQEYPGDYRVSLAFALDDFDPSDATKLYGEPLLLNALDVVEFLGQAQGPVVPRLPDRRTQSAQERGAAAFRACHRAPAHQGPPTHRAGNR